MPGCVGQKLYGGHGPQGDEMATDNVTDPIQARISHLEKYIADHQFLEQQLAQALATLEDFDHQYGRAVDKASRCEPLTSEESALLASAGPVRFELARTLHQAQCNHAPLVAAKCELASRLAGRTVRT